MAKETKDGFKADAKADQKLEDKKETVNKKTDTKPETEKTENKQKKSSKYKMITLTCSGSFRTKNATDEDAEDFDGVELQVPFCTEEYYIGYAQRQFSVWYPTQKKYKVNFRGLIKIRIDVAEESEGDIICIGKDIKQMDWEDLQSLALYKNLREIPYYRVGSLNAARERAYEVYEEKINGKRIFKTSVELKRFKERMEQKEHTESEIEKMVSESLNMIVDPERPERSYSFFKLPPMVVKE